MYVIKCVFARCDVKRNFRFRAHGRIRIIKLWVDGAHNANLDLLFHFLIRELHKELSRFKRLKTNSQSTHRKFSLISQSNAIKIRSSISQTSILSKDQHAKSKRPHRSAIYRTNIQT